MTIFKAFLKILNKNKMMILIYTGMLIGFTATNMYTDDANVNYVDSKPTIAIVNNDENGVITKDLVKYLEDKCKISKVELNEDAINDALFNRQLYYVVYIPKNYSEDFLNGKDSTINIKRIDHYNSELAEMLFKRYINTASIYRDEIKDTDELISKINDTISKEPKVEITSKLDTDTLAKVQFFYTFASYSIIASLVYSICILLSSFREKKINRRNLISSTNYKRINMELLLSNLLLSLVMWLFYVILSIIIIGNVMFTSVGIMYIINFLVFTLCCTSLAFVIGNLITSKNAIGAIVNVIALGSSFLCGVFVPMEWLPNSVTLVAHIIPTYWFVKSNDTLAKLEVINIDTLKPVLINMSIILAFTIIFVILSNIIYKSKRKSE